MNTVNGLYSYATGLAELKQRFAQADTDGNKALSLAEFQAAAKTNRNLTATQSAAVAFASLDADGNDQLTANELSQGLTLTSQVYSALLQGQELLSGNAFLTLLGGASGSTSLFGGSSNYSGLTSSLLGGGSQSTFLTSLTSGGNTGTSLYAALFDTNGSTATQLEALLGRYIPTDTIA